MPRTLHAFVLLPRCDSDWHMVDKAVNAKVRALTVFQEASAEIKMSVALPGARESVALFTSQVTRSTIKGHGTIR